MASVGIHPPKTPVTKGSSGIAKATLPNVCKMPGPPAPFVPSPLPNIATSGTSPKGYTKRVKVERKTVAVRGASFKSMGDIASKATGGGLLSMNTHGPAKFIMPGSFTVKFEGKGVHLLGEPMLNNCGPSGSPPNTGATLGGVVQGTATAGFAAKVGDQAIADRLCDAACKAMAKKLKPGQTRQGQMSKAFTSKKGPLHTPNNTTILPEVSQKIPASVGGHMRTLLSRSVPPRTIPGTGVTAPMSMFRAMATSVPGTMTRWDFVIPRNPGLPATNSNISRYVEVKFPGDKLTANQKLARRMMSKADKAKIVNMRPAKDCACT